ncbi:unnamed protein product [Thlaspi arvense]|uniref:Uncharacterized protein n=1 Tax=Thlaspi arvense TaxID=13288 RepID=A0AAU9RKV3_THLAR|nr:unnamed protein product [Thlaspi arvense]
MDSAAARVPAPDAADDPYKYYIILHTMPQELYRFYQEISKHGRVGNDGVLRTFSTLRGIREALKALLTYGNFKPCEITSYDCQASLGGGFLLVVNGSFLINNTFKRKFTQSFFLAPQAKGYFVLNDILIFVNEPEAVYGEVSQTPTPVTGVQGSVQATCTLVNSVIKEDVEVPEVVDEYVPDVEIADEEVTDDSPKVSDPDYGDENATKKSYASVVKKDKSGVSVSSSLSPKKILKGQEHEAPSDVSPEQILKDQGHQAPSDPSPEQILKDQGHQASSDPSPVIQSDAVYEVVDATENGHDQGFEAVAEGTSVYVKHLPINATIDMLETVFKQFGAIINDGIQVVNQRVGYPFGFVEFEEADAAQKAIEASPLRIGGQKAFVEEKLSTARGNRGSGNRYYGNKNVGGGGNEYGKRNAGGRGNGYGYGNRNVGGRGGAASYGYGNYYRRGGGGGGGRSFNRRGNEYVASNNTY